LAIDRQAGGKEELRGRGSIVSLVGVAVGVVFFAALLCGAVTGSAGVARSGAVTPVRVNFQPAAAVVPSGYVVDSGAAFSDVRGFGWVTQASLSSGSHVPLDLSPNTRDRNLESDQRLDTLIHMQYPSNGSTTAVLTPGAWEYVLANGSYQVTVAVGDPLAGTDPENHVIHVEGVTAIAGFVPSGASGSATRHATATVTVSVSDGRLTVDALGGTNTKLDYVDITPAAVDTTPPAAPAGVAATPGDTQVKLGWTANTEPDLAGYNVYRSTSLPVPLSSPLNGSALLSTPAFLDSGLANGTTYWYVVEAVDTSGNKAQAAAVSATPQAQAPAVDLKVNFQDQATVPPAGYVADWGQAYGVRTGSTQGSGLSYGWVVPGTSTPLNLVGNGRNRNLLTDVRLNTLIHMQGNDVVGFSGVASPGAWELAVPNGTYSVTVAVGDAAANYDSVHRINVEGQLLINNFVPTSANRFATATKTVTVGDGKLTVDPTGGKNTKIDYLTITSDTTASNHPYVTKTSPVNGAVGVGLSSPVTAEVSLPNVGAGIDETTLSNTTVRLFRVSDNTQVAANVNTTGGGDAIILQPKVALDANTNYRFEVTSGLKDLAHATFLPWTSTFTTGTTGGPSPGGTIVFSKVALTNATGQSFTSLVVGPDHKLYAGTLGGSIYRFAINADGTLGTAQVIDTVITANGGPRSVIGLAFDPASTASNLILWVSHSFDWTGTTDGPDWSGKISRLTGPDLGSLTDYVVGLPRSIRDHETNSVAFGPDGALYVTQGSNSSNGAPDSVWGLRPEHVLTAAVLRVNVSAITSPPLNVKSEDGGTYNPFAAGAPVTVYASGLRNAYDLVWHSNGQLYIPTNGSASGGNTPATPSPLPSSCSSRLDNATKGAYTGPQVPGLTSIPDAQNDYLFRVVKGGYYGHPNPTRCEWVLNGGNPTSGTDSAEVPQYPVGTAPDRNWRGFSFDFGAHYSPDGAVEYKGNAFGGALNGRILVARYSAGDDIIALTPGGASLDITASATGISGFTGFTDPLDVTEDNTTGNLYVTELGAQKITLLKPAATSGGGRIATAPSRLIFNGVQNAGATAAQTVTVSNTGSGTLTLSGLSLAGTDAAQFQITSKPTLPIAIAPGGTTTVGIAFNPTTTGPRGATLQIQSDDPTTPTAQVTLRGLGTLGLGGANEPSLQWILDTYQYPVNVGDTDPTNSALPPDPLLGEEVSMQRLQKAGTGPVTIEPLAVFGPQSTAGNVLALGFYTGGDSSTNQQLFTVPNASSQTLNVTANGNTSFDPGASTFGFSANWPALAHTTYSDDALNTWEPTVANRHKVRVYPFKQADGTIVPNAFVVAMEDAATAYDYQDIVFIVRNVTAGGGGGGGGSGPGKYNFQPAAAPVPSGYTADSGAAFSATRGFGWVTQASLSTATHTPLDLTPNTRDRNIESDQRLDTMIHMQYPRTGTSNVATPGAWEVALPNGTYSVTVAVGDPLVGTDAESYTVHVEGVTAINGYVPSGANGSATRHATATVTATVSDGRLTIDAIGGTNTKLDYVDIASSAPDTTPPAVSISVAGTQQSPGVYANRATVTVNASDSGGSGLASTTYSVNGGSFQAYTGPFDLTTPGSYSIVAKAADGAGNVTTTPATSFSIVAAGTNARIAVQNLDGIPFSDRLAFSRIGSVTSPPANGVHDTATVRVLNTGTDPLHISGLPITGSWQLVSPPTLPATIAGGGQLDLQVKFVGTNTHLFSGTLTIQSDDPTTPSKVIQLAGYWQSLPENNEEPTLPQIVQSVFGYWTTIVGSGQSINQHGLVAAVGDEVLSPYWERADTTKPVSVQQMDAFHTQNNTATIYWFKKGNPGASTAIFTHTATDAQTVLPRLNGSTTALAKGSFTPTGPVFGLKVDGEYSDDTINNQTTDQSKGCTGPCGHHVRFWPAKDRAGVLIPDTWIMAMDYSGINYDYNDNVYLISNMKPAALYRLDVSGSANYTDTLGRVWTPDTGLFSPSTAIAESGDLPSDVLGTTDDVIYRTYRGNVGNVPIDQRILSFALPIKSGFHSVDLRLHFAERYSGDTTVGKRVFNIAAEGNRLVSNFDIVQAAGAANTAYVLSLNNVSVDSTLDLVFSAVVDYPSIAGIEVYGRP
jgi:hypothetical protein